MSDQLVERLHPHGRSEWRQEEQDVANRARGRRPVSDGGSDVTEELRCAQFRMTGWTPLDTDVLLRAASDPLIHGFTSMPDPCRQLVDRWIVRQPQLLRQRESATFAVRDPSTNLVLGGAGFVGFEWPHRRGEIGYWVLSEFRRRGIASQALGLLAKWGFEQLGLDRVDLYIDPSNMASKRVAYAQGFRHEGCLRAFRIYRGVRCDLDLFALGYEHRRGAETRDE